VKSFEDWREKMKQRSRECSENFPRHLERRSEEQRTGQRGEPNF
jgi:hypothetical protein